MCDMTHLCIFVAILLHPYQTADVSKEPGGQLANQTIVPLRNCNPAELAKNLQKVFGTSVIIQPTSGTPVTGLLLGGSAAGVENARRIIESLDKVPRPIPIEVILVEYMGEATISTESKNQWDADVQKLKTSGKLYSLRKMDCPLLENQESKIKMAESRPMTTGSTVSRTGIATKSFSYSTMGTTVTAKGRFEPEGQIVVDLNIEDSRVVPETSKPREKNEDVTPDTMGQLTFSNSVPLKRGQIVKVHGISDETKSGLRQIMLYLMAK